MDFIVIFLIFFISKVSCSQIIHSVEGEPVHFNFSYPCTSSEVTVQFANGFPFYRSTSSLQDSEEWVETSIDNLMVKKFRFDSQCGIELRLNPVKKIHRGRYKCFAYKDEGSPPAMTKIRLQVDVPPGKASCALSNEFADNTGGQWVFLNCTASVGNIPGYVQCFQNGEIMPSITGPTKKGHIQQTFLVMTTHPVHCCSSMIDHPKSVCECNDTRWNPSHKEVTTDHCQDTLTTSQTITYVSLTPTQINASTVNTKIPSKDKGLNYNLFIGLLITSFNLLIIVIALIIRYAARCRKGKKDPQAGPEIIMPVKKCQSC